MKWKRLYSLAGKKDIIHKLTRVHVAQLIFGRLWTRSVQMVSGFSPPIPADKEHKMAGPTPGQSTRSDDPFRMYASPVGAGFLQKANKIFEDFPVSKYILFFVIFSIEVIIAFWVSIYLVSWVALAPMNTMRNIILNRWGMNTLPHHSKS